MKQNRIYRFLSFFSFIAIAFLILSCATTETDYRKNSLTVLEDSILIFAEQFLQMEPITVTDDSCERSIGGLHDFYSEGDYWWPNPEDPKGKYIRKDGMTNPNNFTKHREALFRLSEIVGNLTSAYLVSEDEKYANAVVKHCRAWFVNEETQMAPHLLYAQAIQGRYTGRGIGIIDAIHFMEVVQSLMVLEKHDVVPQSELIQMKKWVTEFTKWLTTHPYGVKEMNATNNHGTCWNMQVAVYAKFIENDSIMDFCRDNYRNILLPNQMALDGSFPLETKRTKPYGYSLFNLDALIMNCQILSDDQNDLWNYNTPDGRNMLLGLEYMLPYVLDKSKWTLKPDVMYWENWPVAQPAYIFGAVSFKRNDFYEAWKMHKHFLEVQEVKRNVPIRNPIIWLEQ